MIEICDLHKTYPAGTVALPAEQRLPAGARKIGQRAGEGNRSFQVLWSEGPVAGGEPHEPTLEEAYAAFLARADVTQSPHPQPLSRPPLTPTRERGAPTGDEDEVGGAAEDGRS